MLLASACGSEGSGATYGPGGSAPWGTAGTSGGGSTGTAGTGSGGATGTGGTGGAVVMHTCTPKPDLTCGASAITLASGKVTASSARHGVREL